MKIRKVIVLTIDSLKYERLSVAGYPLSLTPTLDALAQSGISCTQAISHSSCTQMSHPSIWTSSLPLDFGGYDRGIKERPIALAEIFQQNGFKTAALSTSSFLDNYYGYDRGFDDFYSLYGIRSIWYNIYQNYLKHYLFLWQNSDQNNEELCTKIALTLKDTLEFIIYICKKNLDSVSEKAHVYNTITHAHDFEKIIQKCTIVFTELQENPRQFILENIQRLTVEDLYTLLDLDLPTLTFYERATVNAFSGSSFSPIQLMGGNFKNLKGIPPVTFVNGSYMLQTAMKWLERHQSENGFLWICLDDIHEMYCSSSTIQTPFLSPKLFLDRVKLGGQYPGGFSYDLSLKYVDRLIAKFIKRLNTSGQLEHTLIVICSDHGRHWFLDGPLAQRERKNPLDFYEEDLMVPLILWNPHIEQKKIDHLCGLIDLAPTLVDLMGFSPVPSFKGHPVYSDEAKARKYLLAEDAGPGPCDLENDALRIAVRTIDYKYIWEEAIAGEPERSELYDIQKDPSEIDNLAYKIGYKETTQEFKSIVQQRWKTLKGECNS